MTLRPLPTSLLAAAVGLVLGACGGSLYDANGVPRVQGGNQCNPATQHLCAATGNVCQDNVDPDLCGDACVICGAAPVGGVRACLEGAGNAWSCGFTCTAPGTHACGGQCPLDDVNACGPTCEACTAPANATATCVPGAGGLKRCGYTCPSGLFPCASGCCRPTAVAAGGDQTCAIISDGSLRCWGANGSRQLGRSGAGGPSPGLVGAMATGVTQVAVGGRHACAIQAGAVWCWGADDLGQLGDGATVSSGPTPVSPGLGEVTQLVAGSDHTCALVAGTVHCWGANVKGQLGSGTAGGFLDRPALVPGLSGVVELGAFADSTCARASTQAWCWGANGSGQVGTGAPSASVAVPFAVGGRLPGPVASLAVGGLHTCAVIAGAVSSADDGLSCWGDNSQGQLGTGAVSAPAFAPIPASKIDNSRRSIRAVAGTAFTCTAKDALGLKCAGQNDQGQAGVGADPQVDGADLTFGGDLVVAAASGTAAGADHGCGLVKPDPLDPAALVVQCWGRNVEGQLGRTTTGLFDRAPGTVGP